MFEIFFVFGIVGLLMGLIFEFIEVGKCIIIVIMFIGRIGFLMFVFLFVKIEKLNICYFDGEVFMG